MADSACNIVLKFVCFIAWFSSNPRPDQCQSIVVFVFLDFLKCTCTLKKSSKIFCGGNVCIVNNLLVGNNEIVLPEKNPVRYYDFNLCNCENIGHQVYYQTPQGVVVQQQPPIGAQQQSVATVTQQYQTTPVVTASQPVMQVTDPGTLQQV